MGQGFKPQPRDGYEAMKKRLDDMQTQIDSLRGSASIRNSTVSDGGETTWLDQDGNQVVKAGHNTAGERGFSLTRPDGTDLLDFGISQVTPGQSILVLNDGTGQLVFAADAAAGTQAGIFWPLMPAAFGPMIIAQWPFNNTGSFGIVAQCGTYRYSQGFYMAARVVCDSGATAGQVRLMCDGVQIGSTVAVNTSVATAEFRDVVPGAIRTDAFLTLETRVTAGAGNCRAQVFQAQWVPFVLS